MTILISAGHYPEKPGACFEGFCVFDEANRWVDEIIKNLSNDCVLKIPPSTLKHKISFISARSPALVIEIQFNDESIGDGAGACCLYQPYNNLSIKYADELQQTIEPIFGKYLNGTLPGWYRMDEKFGLDFLLAKSKYPTVIIKPEFIHRKKLITDFRESACYNIAQTLKEFKL